MGFASQTASIFVFVDASGVVRATHHDIPSGYSYFAAALARPAAHCGQKPKVEQRLALEARRQVEQCASEKAGAISEMPKGSPFWRNPAGTATAVKSSRLTNVV